MNDSEAAALKFGDAIELDGRPNILVDKPRRSQWDNKATVIYVFGSKGEVLEHSFNPANISHIDGEDPRVVAMRTALAPSMTKHIGGTFGSDPEIFVTSAAGEVIPAWKFLPDKDTAFAGAKMLCNNISQRADKKFGYAGAASYWDGFQAEASFDQGFTCHETMTHYLWWSLQHIIEAARAYSPGATLLAEDVVKVSRKDLLNADDPHVAFGCAPSRNPYGIAPIAIEDPRAFPLRFSGCHYHNRMTNGGFGIPKWYPDGTVIMMDKIAGIILTALGRDMENPKRREYYGRPGEHRLPHENQLEYRTPGSFLMRSPSLFIFGADVVRTAFRIGLLIDGRTHELPDAKDIIMNCDADAALKVITKHKAFFTQVIGRTVSTSTGADNTMKLLLNPKGIKQYLNDLHTEWGLKDTWKHNESGLPEYYRWRNWIQNKI